MKTDKITVSQGPQQVENVLDKIELIALYTGMSRKQASSMRLLAEEMLSATKNILEMYEGQLWMETDDKVFSLHLRVERPAEKSERDKLIALSRAGKITLPKGIFSRLGAAIQAFFMMDDDQDLDGGMFADYAIYGDEPYGMDTCTFSYLPWKQEQDDEKPRDELEGIEKTIIDSIVDDILVTVGKGAMEIIAVKNLN